ncbi:CBO0543 family protein [Neobacillus bataviensis]|uniref:CBO0543 family protein n=1 Tax=Neobacillus bataviensis TaxID=220685 RepID=UPI001CC018B5|nr:CBO0543 family protein [Neobacillus bataviensis]
MYQQMEELHKSLNQIQKEYWIHTDLFSFQWWVIAVVNFGLFFLFIVLIDRQRILPITIAFLVAFIIVGTLDETGVKFNLWEYPHQLLFFTARFNAADFGIVPSLVALLYQYCSKWKPYIIGNPLLSALISFVGATLFSKMDIYKLLNWNYFYSFLVSLVSLIVIKAIVDLIVKKSKKHN